MRAVELEILMRLLTKFQYSPNFKHRWWRAYGKVVTSVRRLLDASLITGSEFIQTHGVAMPTNELSTLHGLLSKFQMSQSFLPEHWRAYARHINDVLFLIETARDVSREDDDFFRGEMKQMVQADSIERD